MTARKLSSLAFLFFFSSCTHFLGGHFKDHPENIFRGLSLDSKKLLDDAFSDVDDLIDYHAHVVGVGTNNSGIYFNHNFFFGDLVSNFKTALILSASAIHDEDNADTQYIERLKNLLTHVPKKMRMIIFALDYPYDSEGNINHKETNIYVPNDYVFRLASSFPELFIPAMSVHPYRKDAILELRKWAKRGGRFVKWIPNAMAIDPNDSRCDGFYQEMKRLDLILISHGGEERALARSANQEWGNPLRLRRALDHDVKVIVAHCASLGSNEDLDYGGEKTSFDLFLRMMDEKKYRGLLFGDISSTTFSNRIGKPLSTLLEREDLHHRLVNGSDYPLPAVNILLRTSDLARSSYITRKERKGLNEIYHFNPLLFDYVVKRTIKHPVSKKKFSKVVFTENPLLKTR